MAYDKVIDSAQLEADLTTVADAIRAKGETTEPLTFPDEYVTAVEAIEVGVDTSDATAGEKNIEDGYTAYVNGKKVQGALIYTNDSKYVTQRIYTDNTYGDVVICEATNSRKIIHPENSKISTMTPFAEFGNASAADVASGKTFTSTAGLKVTGTYEPPISAGGVSF